MLCAHMVRLVKTLLTKNLSPAANFMLTFPEASITICCVGGGREG